MRLDFVKMHGLGNDFMLIDVPDRASLAERRAMARAGRSASGRRVRPGAGAGAAAAPRHRMPTTASSTPTAARSSSAAMARAVSRAAAYSDALRRRHGRVRRRRRHGASATYWPMGAYAVDLGVPNFDPRSLPFVAPASPSHLHLTVGGEEYEFGAVSIGNPHAVLRVDAVESSRGRAHRPRPAGHPRFPRQVNVGFMQVIDANHIRLRVYERGVGRDQACGTGACAAVVIGRDLGVLGAEVEVHVPGGRLERTLGRRGNSDLADGTGRECSRHVEL